MGQKGHAMLLDCRDQSVRYVPVGGRKGADIRVVISNTNVKHELGGGEYGVRRKQCEAAVAAIQKKHPAVRLFAGTLRPPPCWRNPYVRAVWMKIVYRRAPPCDYGDCSHYAICRRAGKAGLWALRRVHVHASHASLRDDYEGFVRLNWIGPWWK